MLLHMYDKSLVLLGKAMNAMVLWRALTLGKAIAPFGKSRRDQQARVVTMRRHL